MLETERAAVGSGKFSLRHRMLESAQEEGKERRGEGGRDRAEEYPQERMAIPLARVLSRQLQEHLLWKPTTLPMLPHKTTGTGWIHLLNISQEGKVVSQVWASKSSESPSGLFERLLCETSGPYWQSAVRSEMLLLWKTILCLCVNTPMIDFTV